MTFDQYGIRNGNSSRYVITASNLLFGMIYFTFVKYAAEMKEFSRKLTSNSTPRLWVVVGTCGYALFVVLSARAYADSVRIYKEVRNTNFLLMQGFSPDGSDTEFDKYLYPNRDRLRTLRSDLVRLRIGPYGDAPIRVADGLTRLAASKAADEFGVNGVRRDSSVGPVLFAHPYSRFEQDVAPEHRTVRFAYGILSEALSATPPTDGVEFRISLQQVDGARVVLWSRTVRPSESGLDRGTHQGTLSWDGGGSSKLLFETLPAGTTANDWAYWSNLTFDK